MARTQTAHPTAIFLNARIVTLDPQSPTAEAMAVCGERILALGSREEILSLAAPHAAIIDLEGQVVLPGFNDSHMHLLSWGFTMDGVELQEARSIQELIQLGLKYVQNNPGRKWILGRGFNDESFSTPGLPTRNDLDQISTGQPLVFTRVCGHICTANSRALELAGIGAATPDPPGGRIDRDPATGEPTGVLRENAIELVTKLIPSPTVADLKRILRGASSAAAASGLTTVQSNDLHGAHSLTKRLQAYQELDAAGELPIRIILQATMPTLEDLQAYLDVLSRTPQGSKLSLGPLKLYADGSLGGRTAALTCPYSDAPETDGMLIHNQEELNELVLAAAQHNLQVAVHAIGDRAVDLVLNSYACALERFHNWNKRPRIIHAQITRYDQLIRMAQLGVVADIQPIFVPTDLHFAERRIGARRAEYAYAWKTMNRLGISTAGGSDSPVEPCNPLWGMHAAITRQDQTGYPQGGWHPQECLSGPEALTLFTAGSAYAAHEENLKGTLSPGKLADFVVLPEDPTQVEAEALLNLKVTASYVGGSKVSPESIPN